MKFQLWSRTAVLVAHKDFVRKVAAEFDFDLSEKQADSVQTRDDRHSLRIVATRWSISAVEL
jgi:hypothetical protein